MHLTGFHHLTAVTTDAVRNHQFYTRTLGLRLVKKTVNQDDVSAYHLFYADGRATPGTDITFFDWPVPPERRGTSSIVRTGFRVGGGDSLDWWARRFDELGVKHGGVHARDGRATVDFEDFEGQRLSLVADGSGEMHPWERGSVPAVHQIRGLGPITLSVPELAPTDSVLARVMAMSHVREYKVGSNGDTARVHVYRMGTAPAAAPPRSAGQAAEPKDDGAAPAGLSQAGEDGAAVELHVAVEPGRRPARTGAGGVHHVAFRTPNDQEYQAWLERLQQFGVPSSGAVDRFYFRSLYFREPNGVLFEIATDGPGFAADEPMETLGERLALPPFLEPRRAQIEAGLKPLAIG